MLERVSSSSATQHHLPSKQHFQPSFLATDEEDSDDGDDAEAIAEVLLGRKPFPRLSNGNDSKHSCLEEGQVCEDELLPDVKKPHQEDFNPQHPITSLFHRLGPPSQPASLTSASSSGRRNTRDQLDSHHLDPTRPIQHHDPRALRLLSDHPPHSSRDFRISRGPKRPHSPTRRRRNSRSRSPIRNRHSPPSSDPRRRGSLSSRITINHRRSSCSPDTLQLELPSRPKRMPRRFSSPSNSLYYRRDSRDREVPHTSRYQSNLASDPRRSRQHHDIHAHSSHAHVVHQDPNSTPLSTVQISNAGSPSKSPPSLNNNPDSASPKLLQNSVLVANLPSYYVLTPKRLYDRLTESVSRQRCRSVMPYELKLYRYARSDCVVAELRFNSLDDARQFTQRAERTWPASWYTTKKLPPDPQMKNVEFTILEDKQISWPSNYETYAPKIRSGSYEEIPTGPQAQPQLAKSPQAASSVDGLSTASSTAVRNTASSPVKINPQADYYRPKPPRLPQDAINTAVEEQKNELPPPTHIDTSQPVAIEISPPENGSGTLSPQAMKDTNSSLAKFNLDSDGGFVVKMETTTPPSMIPSDEPKQRPNHVPSSVHMPTPPSKPSSDMSESPRISLHSVNQSIPDSEPAKAVSVAAERSENEETKSSVLLSKLHPSLTWPVLQSHFSLPNRPRDFRIFEPFQVAYGSFFSTLRSHPCADTECEEGCMISFSDTNTARNFCRVLEQNPPFQSVHVRLVDAADIQFVPSALIVRKPAEEEYPENGVASDPANRFIESSLQDIQQQLEWERAMGPEMGGRGAGPMGIRPLGELAEGPFGGASFAMAPGLMYRFPYGADYQQANMLGYPQCSSVPLHYPYAPPAHTPQELPRPSQPPTFPALDPAFAPLPATQLELQDRLKKILKDRKAKSGLSG